MPICKEQKHQTLGSIPRFKTSAGLEPDISSASTVANCNEWTHLQHNVKKKWIQRSENTKRLVLKSDEIK